MSYSPSKDIDVYGMTISCIRKNMQMIVKSHLVICSPSSISCKEESSFEELRFFLL